MQQNSVKYKLNENWRSEQNETNTCVYRQKLFV